MYMEDYNQILVIVMSYANDDTSNCDYIVDFESVIKNIESK